MKKQLELQGIKLKVLDNNIEKLKKTLAGAPTTDILGKKDNLLKEKDGEITKRDNLLKEKETKVTKKDIELASKKVEITLKDISIGNLNNSVS